MNGMKPINCSPNDNFNCSIHIQHSHALLPIYIPAMIAGILVFLLNGGVFAILIKDKNIRKNPYLFLVLMLCVSDFTVGLSVICIGPIFFIPSLNGNKFFTVLQTVLMTNGLCLSLLQTFLISIQRYLVLCKENWNLYIFQQNRKYYTCVGSSIVVIIINSVLVSPPDRNCDLYDDRLLSYVFHGHYQVHSIYIRFLSMFLLSLTLIFYSLTVCYVMKTYKKVHPMGNLNSTSARITTINVQMAQAPATLGDTNHKKKTKDNGQENSQSRRHHQLISIRQRKIVSSLKLVGLLIIFLLILTGPFIITLWNDNTSAIYNAVSTYLCVLNSFANPFIYLWRLHDVREFIKSRLCC